MSENKKVNLGDAVVIGFAMFATFFGAGNMIFPPFMGNRTGDLWFIGFLCFILADVGLALLTVFSMIRKDGTINSVFDRIGNVPALTIATLTMAIVGPALCIPRTCATTFEMAVVPFFPEFSSWIFGLIFFVIVYILISGGSKVVDIIGKYMTPILLVSLAVLVIKGIISPVGNVIETSDVVTAANIGFLNGYQTMDVLGALAFTLIVAKDIRSKGYDTPKSRMSITICASIVTFLGLFVVYGGLSYLGATSSSLHMGHHNQTELLVEITGKILGSFGKALLGIIVLFACLTTAVGLTSSAADYFHSLFNGKFSMKTIILVICAVGVVLSNVGITMMITVATPLLNILYPLLLTQIVLSFFGHKIKKDSVFKGAAIGALIVCVLAVGADFDLPLGFVYKLPLSGLGLYWILPATIGGVVGAILPKKK